MELSPPRAESELRGLLQPTRPRSFLGGKVGEKRLDDRYYNSINATDRFHFTKPVLYSKIKIIFFFVRKSFLSGLYTKSSILHGEQERETGYVRKRMSFCSSKR